MRYANDNILTFSILIGLVFVAGWLKSAVNIWQLTILFINIDIFNFQLNMVGFPIFICPHCWNLSFSSNYIISHIVQLSVACNLTWFCSSFAWNSCCQLFVPRIMQHNIASELSFILFSDYLLFIYYRTLVNVELVCSGYMDFACTTMLISLLKYVVWMNIWSA